MGKSVGKNIYLGKTGDENGQIIGMMYKGRQHVSIMGMGKEQANIDKEQMGMHKGEWV